MIVQRRPPWEAFHPVAELELMPFRDAGRGPSDFNLSIQDCLWGMWKAMQNGLCDMNEFSVEEYEYYEKVENGDWNWLTPGFIAFASPVDATWVKAEKDRKAAGVIVSDDRRGSSSLAGSALQRKLPQPFLNCLDYFEKRNVRLVVRLNTELYDKQVFVDRGIEHVDLYFDDGTNPTDEITRSFIDLADEVISGGGAVAVHVSRHVHLVETPVYKIFLVQSRPRSYRHADRSLHDLEVRLHSQRSDRVHAYRPSWICGRPTTTLHVPQAAGMDEVVRRR
jgi:cell division cycle 14